MDLKKVPSELKDRFQKYKFAALILILGIGMMLIPVRKDTTETVAQAPQKSQEANMNEELAEILCLIEGAGRVQVLLTESVGEETVFQTDEDLSVDSDSTTSKVKTIIVTGADRAQDGLVKQINPPKYLGAIILCQGADSPSVRLAITDAVSKITGLGADKISVLKLK